MQIIFKLTAAMQQCNNAMNASEGARDGISCVTTLLTLVLVDYKQSIQQIDRTLAILYNTVHQELQYCTVMM